MLYRKGKKIKRSISTQINLIVFIIYSAVALTIVTLHITAEFRHSKSLIIDNFLKFQKLYEENLVSVLVSKNQDLIFNTLKHQLQFPDLLGIKIEESDTHQLISQLGICETKDGVQLYTNAHGEKSIVKTGFLQSGLLEHNYILEFLDGKNKLRTVEITLFSGIGNLFEKAKVSFYYIIINVLLITLVLGLSYINISKILLTRPLSALTSAAQSISMDNLEHFKLLVETPNQNELKILEKSFIRMVRQLLSARKKLEIGILNLKRIAEEGLKISSQRSYHKLSGQVKASFAKITDLGGDVELVFSGKLFDRKDNQALYFVGEDDKSIIKVNTTNDFKKEAHSDAFNILDTKDQSLLAEVRFVNHYTEGIGLKNVEPIFRPLLTNISNTIKNISMVKEIQKYVKDLEQNNIALRQMDKLKDEFLANTSHELRTPLNGIIGISESLLDGVGGDLSEEQSKNLLMIVQSGKKLSHLINDILDFSKMKNMELQLDMQQTSIIKNLEIVLGLLIPVVKEKNILLKNEVSQNTDFVYADENRLQQILFNLIGNAIKFTDGGKITITAKSEKDFIEIGIADTGIGISENQLDKIFSPFEQFDGTIAKEYGGTGLGLSISKSLIELQGGEIKVKSIENLGSVFSFTLQKFNMQTYLDKKTGTLNVIDHQEELTTTKIVKNNSPQVVYTKWENPNLNPHQIINDFKLEKAPEKQTKQNVIAEDKPKTILVVDDEMINLQVLINHLKLLGYTVISAKDGFQALEHLDHYPIDLVLLDLMMPKMSGYTVCEKIREKYSHYELPVIILTAKNQIEDLIAGFKSGANDYITKPFYKEELLTRVQTHLKAKESVEQLKEINRLAQEIKLREQTEQELESSKRRLIRMLDFSERSIASFDQEGALTFFNQGAEQLFGYQGQQILGHSLKTILREEDAQEVLKSCRLQTDQKGNLNQPYFLTGRHQTGESLPLKASISQISTSRNLSFAIYFNHDTNLENESHLATQREQALNSALSEVALLDANKRKTMVNEVRAHDIALDGITDFISEDQKGLKVRQAIVDLMSTTITCWETALGKTKIDLAEESDIWKVYLDKGTYRTRTLDKYFLLSTLPKKPRWRSVISTAIFVLSQKKIDETWKQKLEVSIKHLQNCLCKK